MGKTKQFLMPLFQPFFMGFDSSSITHIVASAVIYSSAYSVARFSGASRFRSCLVAADFALAAGLTKELLDFRFSSFRFMGEQYFGDPDICDFISDAAGTSLAAASLYFMERTARPVYHGVSFAANKTIHAIASSEKCMAVIDFCADQMVSYGDTFSRFPPY